MSNYEIIGNFYDSPLSSVVAVLEKVFGEIKVRDRYFGYELDFQYEKIKLHVDSADNNGEIWYLTVNFEGTETALDSLLELLIQSLVEADILYIVNKEEYDTDDNLISEGDNLCHPDFDNRYKEVLRKKREKT